MDYHQAKKFVAGLDKAINFHKNNTNDPHGIGVAVRCALIEVRSAFMEAMQMPYTQDQPDAK